ncbi:MAG: hypothetical protein JEZ03_03370 [Bacteroidales bacterium]|nr:hypothetical protein [Bacteroidales bacterium]
MSEIMREVIIVVPEIEKDQNIEIDVRISGKTQSLKYKIELLSFEDEPVSSERVTVLRHKISEYDKDWELVTIGAPEKNHIPLMFRKQSK